MDLKPGFPYFRHRLELESSLAPLLPLLQPAPSPPSLPFLPHTTPYQSAMGRKKIEIRRLADDRNRQVTFLKRKGKSLASFLSFPLDPSLPLAIHSYLSLLWDASLLAAGLMKKVSSRVQCCEEGIERGDERKEEGKADLALFSPSPDPCFCVSQGLGAQRSLFSRRE